MECIIHLQYANPTLLLISNQLLVRELYLARKRTPQNDIYIYIYIYIHTHTEAESDVEYLQGPETTYQGLT